MISRKQFMISRETVGAVSILLHAFKLKSSGKSVLVQYIYMISMNSVCLRFVSMSEVNDGEVLMQCILV